MFSSENLSNVLRAVSSFLQVPVMIILILMILASIFMVGCLALEFFLDHRKLKASLPLLVDELKKNRGFLEPVIHESGLLKRQKNALLEVLHHPDLTPSMRESLAAELLYEEKVHYDSIVRISDLIAKLGPMFGLMGTLIPLGPGIIALGRGDTLTLSQSLLIAFDTTVAGLAAAAVCFVISSIRKKWYAGYLSVLEMCMECFVELESETVSGNRPAGLPDSVRQAESSQYSHAVRERKEQEE